MNRESPDSNSSVTVVIPAYEAAHTIGHSLKSVAAQTVRPAQTIVVDDGSPHGDELAAVVAKFPGVELLRHEHGGAACARNFGIDHARCEWISFIDADDHWEPTKLERQLHVARENPEADIIGSRWFIDENGKTEIAPVNLDFYNRLLPPSAERAFDVAYSTWTGTLMVRREILAEERFLSGLVSAEDRDLWIRLASTKSMYLLDETLATYVHHHDSLTNSDLDRDCSCMLNVIDRHAGFLELNRTRKYRAMVFRDWASVYLAKNRPRRAVIPALRRLALEPLSAQAWYILAKASLLSAWNRE